MGLCINPTKKIRVNVSGGYFVFTVRQPTTQEFLDYKKNRLGNMNSKNGKVSMESEIERHAIDFVDKLLIDVKAFDEKDNPQPVEYDDGTGKAQELKNDVKNWQQYIPANIRFQVCTVAEYVDVQLEETALKN